MRRTSVVVVFLTVFIDLLGFGVLIPMLPLYAKEYGATEFLGGLLLGYGARIAYGCNIGAYFSGIASGSLHGWLWLPAAFAGNVVGTSLRPHFGLAVERAPRS